MKKENGITLVALVITIIVLLILAGVTIVTLTGDNGLLQKAQTAKEENEDAKELELIKLAVSAAQLAGQGSITTDNLNGELRENFSDNSINVDEKSGGWILNKNKEYTIYENGKVEEGNLLPLLPKEYQQVEYIESSGTQYIDTNVIPNQDTYSKAIFENVSSTIYTKAYVIGAMLKWESKMYAITPYTVFGYNSKNIQSTSFRMPNVKFTAILNKNECELLDEQKSLLKGNMTYGLFSPELSIFICANHTSDGVQEFYIGKIFNIEIKQNDLNTRNYIPCYSTTTVTDVEGKQCPKDTIGLYDLVEGKFYTNKGTGTFGYGMEDGTYVAPTNN